MEATAEQTVIKKTLAFLDNMAKENKGDDAVDKSLNLAASSSATYIRSLCEIYGVDSGDAMPFNTLCEEVLHNAEENVGGL